MMDMPTKDIPSNQIKAFIVSDPINKITPIKKNFETLHLQLYLTRQMIVSNRTTVTTVMLTKVTLLIAMLTLSTVTSLATITIVIPKIYRLLRKRTLIKPEKLKM